MTNLIRTKLVEMSSAQGTEKPIGEIFLPVPIVQGVMMLDGKLRQILGWRWEVKTGEEAFLVVALLRIGSVLEVPAGAMDAIRRAVPEPGLNGAKAGH